MTKYSFDDAISAIEAFNEERNWEIFHSPVNLAKSIVIESSELLECFQWDDNNYDKQSVCNEIADIMNYCIRFCSVLNVDISEIIMEKIEMNRAKYPVNKSKGLSTKYTKLF